MKQEFWKNWKRVTKQEASAIEIVKAARKIILKEIKKSEIVSIYVKGSLVRRELNKTSDVDILAIVKLSSSLKKIKALNKKYGKNYNPELQFAGFSLWELKTGKRTKRGGGTPPNRFTKHVNNFKLIYGMDLSKEKFFMPSDKKYLKNRISFIRDRIIPKYESGKFDFQGLLKQVFWLIESEEFAKGNHAPHGFKALSKSIKDKKHIIHDALRIRLKGSKDKKEEMKFVNKLKNHLKELEKLV